MKSDAKYLKKLRAATDAALIAFVSEFDYFFQQ